ncbi:ras-related protein Rab-26-like [Physella acuta]|uniref:ras-related protein Rab-26-like n=1 Tax=Physella acuta TaxID=109671 RepID=UPI0027DD8B11|nr:ras-related protein Rab-26-like [Physella acuta]
MNQMMGCPNNRMRVIMLGDYGVGKTCLMNRYLFDQFDLYYRKFYVEFGNRTVDVFGVKVKLQIWDTFDQERLGWELFTAITKSYYRDVAGIVMVFDLTKKSSFDNIQYWLQQVHEHAGENVDIVLVGNKVDLAESRAIDHETASSLAQTIGAMYVECSAKTGANVNLVFTSLASKLVNRVPVQQEEPVRLQSGTLDEVPCYGKDTCSLF